MRYREVHSGENGYLVKFAPSSVNEDTEKLIEGMAERILETFADLRHLEAFHRRSYEIAQGFFLRLIEIEWKKLYLEDSKREGSKYDL